MKIDAKNAQKAQHFGKTALFVKKNFGKTALFGEKHFGIIANLIYQTPFNQLINNIIIDKE